MAAVLVLPTLRVPGYLLLGDEVGYRRTLSNIRQFTHGLPMASQLAAVTAWERRQRRKGVRRV